MTAASEDMSKEAPWIALAIDWQDSAMLDGASHGIRLAWICLLCFVKAQGRAGRARLRDNGFARKYDLDVEAVRGMLRRAEHAGAVIVDGDVVTVVNWRTYQDPRVRSADGKPKRRENKAEPPDNRHFTKTAVTTHTIPPPTTHPPPKKKLPAGAGDPLFSEFWAAFPAIRKQDRADAWKAWRQAVKEAEPAVLVAAAVEYAASDVGRGQYAKGPATWLRKGCWADDREAWRDHDSLPNGKPPEKPYSVINARKFAAMEAANQFTEVVRSQKTPTHIRGITRDGMRYECIDYPLATPHGLN